MILIDTNIYLAFYQTERLNPLLNVLPSIREHIFVPQQIVDEVERNKVSCFSRSLKELLKLPDWKFPDHLLPPGNSTDLIREEVVKFNQNAEALRRKVNGEFESVLRTVINSTDHISKALEQFFRKADVPSVDQLERARRRREINNPPGKASDPLGDELTWEQFLDASRESEHVWVITKDGDYTENIGTEKFLKPLLVRDLTAIKKRTSIHCFDTLSKSVSHIQASLGLLKAGLPTPQDLVDLDLEERALPTTTAPPDFTVRYNPMPSLCPKCGGPFGEEAYLRSQYGGLTLQHLCTTCHFSFDTGESWD